MTLHRMLDHQGRLQARGRAALLAGRVALVGAVLVAVVLLLERMGVDLPFVWMPGAVAGSGPFAKLFGK